MANSVAGSAGRTDCSDAWQALLKHDKNASEQLLVLLERVAAQRRRADTRCTARHCGGCCEFAQAV